MPRWASSIRPRRRAVAPVNAPFSCPNSSLSSKFSDSAAQLIATKGPSTRRLHACTARAATSLPVPLSPSSSTVASVGATLRSADSTAAMAAAPYDSCGLPSRRATSARAAQAVALGGSRHQQPQLGGARQRLLQVVERPQLHRLQRVVDRAMGGDHDDLHLRLILAQAPEQIHAAHAGHLEIGQHHLEALLGQGP